MDEDFLRLLAFIGFVASIVAAIIAGAGAIQNEIQATAARNAEYDVRNTMFTCIAKVNGRWFDCDAVLNNQIVFLKVEK